jgi:6-phosphogluconolactonase
MSTPEITRFPNADELATRVAALWVEALACSEPGKPWHVALSGGRIAIRLFQAIAQHGAALRSAGLERVEFFWADERCVPPDDPESNYGLAQQHLFGPLGVQESRIHRIRGELDKDDAAKQAEAEMLRIVTKTDTGQPRLDLALLGMGEDGHTASLFPNGPPLPEAVVYAGVIGAKPPPNRVTLNFPVLVAAREAWVLISGAGKEDAFRRSLEPGRKTPMGKVLALRSSTRIFTDLPG